MPAKKARSEKRSLSRQAVAARRRSAPEVKREAAGGGVAGRALTGVVLLFGSVLLLLSLMTFNPRDRIGPGFRNAAGPVGHLLAESLFDLLGFCGYGVPLAGLYGAGVLFLGGRQRRRWTQWMAAMLLLASGAVLTHLALAGRPLPFAPGGWVGASLAVELTSLFSTAGTLVIVSALCVVALIVGTRVAFLKLCAAVWRGVTATGRRLGDAGAAVWSAQVEAFRERRAWAAQQKLEEAAFLAQLEADQEEMSPEERDAADADAMAEEAFRLAKEAPLLPEPAVRRPRRLPAQASAPVEPAVPAEAQQPVEASVARRRERKGLLSPAPSVEGREPQPPPAPVPVPRPQAVIRTPVIVEPKAPPQPTRKKDAEQFEFVGDRKSFTLPPLDVLESDKAERSALDKDAFLSTAERLRAKLADFGIVGEVVEIRPGPVVTMYEFLPGPGIKVSKIASLADDLAMAMEAMRVRIVAPIPGKGVVGIEVPNKDRETVYLKEIAEQDAFTKSPSKLTMCLGKDIEGMPYVLDLAKAPHLLIAGTTGSGKSVAVNSMIMSVLLKATPEEVRFIMVDPKMLELSVYEGIPHLLLPVVTDPKKAALALRWAVEEMERRYLLLSQAGVRNIAGYNKLVEAAHTPAKSAGKAAERVAPAPAAALPAITAPAAPTASKKKMLIVDVGDGETEEEALARSESGGPPPGVAAPKEAAEDLRAAWSEAGGEAQGEPLASELRATAAALDEKDKKELKKLPYIVVIIDELADLMMVASREVETYIARLAQMARAAGIHLMTATQRPSTDVVTGVIKANFPSRISFMLRSKPDSMTILGTTGAEALLGMGDMLIMPPTSANLQRVHGAYVSEREIKRAVDHLKAQGKPVYDESILKPRDEEGAGEGEGDDLSDELYDQALAVVGDMRQVSISMLQRKMRIGYNRSARMIERMEREGVVGPADGAKPREVLIRPVGEMPGSDAI